MARQIQLNLLPKCPPRTDYLSICAQSVPSRVVGGDFYDFIELPDDRIGIVIADASGKGMPAALMIAQIQAIIRSEVNNGTPIDTMMCNMNRQVASATTSEKFVTLFYGELNCRNGALHYANAGHNYPVLARRDGRIELLKEGGTIIGAIGDMPYEASTVQLDADDLLFLFTDGLSEAMDEKEIEYGEARIQELVCSHRERTPDELVELIMSDARRFDPTDPPRDDTTVVALRVNGDKQA